MSLAIASFAFGTLASGWLPIAESRLLYAMGGAAAGLTALGFLWITTRLLEPVVRRAVPDYPPDWRKLLRAVPVLFFGCVVCSAATVGAVQGWIGAAQVEAPWLKGLAIAAALIAVALGAGAVQDRRSTVIASVGMMLGLLVLFGELVLRL